MSSDDKATRLAGQGFDAVVWELWPYLAGGAEVSILDDDTRISPSSLLEHFTTRGITIAFLPTPLAEKMLDIQWPGNPALRILLTGGDKLVRSPLRPPPFQLVNNYGPTEVTVVTTSGAVEDRDDHSPPIGRPIRNLEVFLLDGSLRMVPAGSAGELCVSGEGLARGYINLPERTAVSFVPNPFSPKPGSRLYRSGDLGRYRPDGNIEFLGRIDEQVKVRGFRIEPGEIQAALLLHPDVVDAFILIREDATGEKRLVAYVVGEKKQPPDTAELRDFLGERLPGYMVPSSFVLLGAIPLTPNGKVDRKALPAPDRPRPASEAFSRPGTPAEETIARIWSEVLGLGRIGVHENFFELGGDSILSIQVAARASREGLRFTPKELFRNPTVAALARIAGKGTKAAEEPAHEEGPIPLTPIQRWFFEQCFPEPHHWNQSVLFAAKHPLLPGLIEQCVEHLGKHHDALRLRFSRLEEDWCQTCCSPGGEVPFCWVDLSLLPEQEAGLALETCAGEAQASLDLTEGPLFRVVYFTLNPDGGGRLLFVVHHLAMDGVSWRILLEDFHSAHERLRAGKQAEEPFKTAPFRVWARRIAQYAQTPDIEKDLPFWAASTRGHTDPIPVDFPEGENTEASERAVSTTLPEEVTSALLHEVHAAYGAEMKNVLLAGVAMSLAQWTGSRRFLIDMEGHGREELFEGVDTSRTIGWFTSLYPVLLDLEGVEGPGESLKAVKEQLRRIPRQGIGYGVLRYLSGSGVHLSRLPRPQISFNYLGRFDQTGSQTSIFLPAFESAGPERSPRGNRTHCLGFSGSVLHGRLRLVWSYSENLHMRSTIEQLCDHLVSRLTDILNHSRSVETARYTPSDFPDVALTQNDIEALTMEILEASPGDS